MMSNNHDTCLTIQHEDICYKCFHQHAAQNMLVLEISEGNRVIQHTLFSVLGRDLGLMLKYDANDNDDADEADAAAAADE